MTRGEKNKQSNDDDDSSSRTELKYWLLKNKLDFGKHNWMEAYCEHKNGGQMAYWQVVKYCK